MFELSELIAFLRKEGLLGETDISGDVAIKGFSSLAQAELGALTWSRSKEVDWKSVRSSVLICPEGTEAPSTVDVVIIPVANPRLAFIKAVERFYDKKEKTNIEDTARIGDNCSISENVYIGHYVVIGDNVSISENTRIYSHVTIYDNVKIGCGCTINSGTVIGADGFGYERENGIPRKFPHIGGVIIEDNVEIGSNTSIDRGTLGNTVIEKDSKIDNLCHIAHNVVIGEGSLIIACSMIGGSTRIGRGSWVAPCAAILDGLTIGEGSTVGMGAVVIKDIAANDVVAGVPARSIKASGGSKT